MLFLVSCLVEDILPQHRQVWPVWSKEVTSLVASYASVCSLLVVLSMGSHKSLGSLSGLASQLTARQGNILGILGVSSGILSSLLAVGFSPEVLAQFAGVAGIGSIVGKYP